MVLRNSLNTPAVLMTVINTKLYRTSDVYGWNPCQGKEDFTFTCDKDFSL